jgi:FtsP/CotA-like multicopper oxidase with cupredoxin domain
VPGPAIRATEGDRLRITFRNHGSHPHSMHFHGIHSARVDGVVGAGVIGPGGVRLRVRRRRSAATCTIATRCR